LNQIFNNIGKSSNDFFDSSLITNFFSHPFFNNNLINNGQYSNNNDNHNEPNQSFDNNWNPDKRIIDPIGIPGVFSLNFGYNPIFDEFFNAVNNSFYPGFEGNDSQQINFPENQNNNYDRNYLSQSRNRNFQQQAQQNINYRDTKIYDV